MILPRKNGKWGVRVYLAGKQCWLGTFDTKDAAERAQAKQRLEQSVHRPNLDPNLTLAAYADYWLTVHGASVKPRTKEGYTYALKTHLLPALGKCKVRALHRGQIKLMLSQKLASGLERATVRILYATLRTLLNAAIDDGLITANPAAKLGRTLRLSKTAAERQEDVMAMTLEQLWTFEAKARALAPRYAPFFLLLARTGMRPGEALGLQWDDCSFGDLTVRVSRQVSAGRLQTPKAGHGRTIELTPETVATLQALRTARKADALKRGTELSPWVFLNQNGDRLELRRCRRVFKRVLEQAGLPQPIQLYHLKHTYASNLISQGVSLEYVRRQLGHSSIKVTVDIYGRWLPMGSKGAGNLLDRPEKCLDYLLRTGSLPAARKLAKLEGFEANASAWVSALNDWLG